MLNSTNTILIVQWQTNFGNKKAPKVSDNIITTMYTCNIVYHTRWTKNRFLKCFADTIWEVHREWITGEGIPRTQKSSGNMRQKILLFGFFSVLFCLISIYLRVPLVYVRSAYFCPFNVYLRFQRCLYVQSCFVC